MNEDITQEMHYYLTVHGHYSIDEAYLIIKNEDYVKAYEIIRKEEIEKAKINALKKLIQEKIARH